MAWVGRDLKDHLVPTSLPWAGMPLTRLGCPKPYPTWPTVCCVAFSADIQVVEIPHHNESVTVMLLVAEARSPCQQAPLDQVACSRLQPLSVLYWFGP